MTALQTKHIKIEDIQGQEADLLCAASIIQSGGLVVFPTETVYGLGGDGTNQEAAKKIYAAKGRPSDNPLIIHVADPADAERYANALKSGGRLLVSGFLTEDIAAIEERIETLGFKRLQMLNDEGWVAISFEKL